MNQLKFRQVFIQYYLWMVYAVLGMAGFFCIWNFMPHHQQIDSIWQLIFKISCFILLVMSIAFFPNQLKWEHLLLLLPTLAYAGYLGPKLSYYGFVEIQKKLDHIFSEYYTLLYLLLYPGIILTACFNYRIGGGAPGRCIKLGLCGIVIIFSGFLDLMWYIVNPTGIPEVMQYAHHIKVFIGHYPRYIEGVIFALLHIPLLLIIILAPLDKWFQSIFKEKVYPESTFYNQYPMRGCTDENS